MIKVENLSYGSILNDVSFSLDRNKIVMILGENGCGKTTLIKNLIGILECDAGRIMYEGKDISSLSLKEKAAIFSYVPQIKTMVDTITLEECVVSGKTRFLSSFQTPSYKDYEDAYKLLEEFGIGHLNKRLLSEVSGGELQLAYVARAMIQDSKILVMDEPCTYLDFQKQYLFLEKISSIKKTNKTLLISIHDPNLALRYADEIILMSKGKIYSKLSNTDVSFKEKFCEQYNELFGNHFIYNKESDFLFWK